MMLADFMVRALLGGLGIALVAGPLGCFIVWRRMAYFGAALAHASLLGVALGLLLDVDPAIGITIIALAAAASLAGLQGQSRLAGDTVLGIFAHGALALGLVLVAFLEGYRFDLMGYLFGDILALSSGDLVWIYIGAVLVLAALAWLWRPLLFLTVDEDLALVSGVSVEPIRFAFMLLIALVVALAMKLVGLMLIVSLLIIPAATARALAATPERMAVLAALAAALAVVVGLGASMLADTPAGPSIVTAATALFLLSLPAGRGKKA